MSASDFRRFGHAVVDWLADYQNRVESLAVMSQVKPGQIRAALPAQPPVNGEPFEKILADMDELIMPGLMHWQSPNFFGFFPANISGPSILGEFLCAGLGAQGMLWATSPACTELETHVLDWLADMLALPEKFKSSGAPIHSCSSSSSSSKTPEQARTRTRMRTRTSGDAGRDAGAAGGGGVIQDSASSAILCALLAARERATNLQSNESGCDRRLTAYASTQAHSSVEKAVKIAGLGRQNLRLIEVDDRFALRPGALAQQITKDRAAGLTPCFVCATAGTTSSNGFDPVPEIGRLCQEQGIWLHVDAAMSGTAALCPEFRHLQAGLERADSYAFNPHKWMFTNFDCDCFYVADRAALIRALSILPEYLRNQASESGAVIDYRDWQVPLGRRFRALKLWFVIRHYGVEGLRHHIRRHVALAQEFARWVEDSKEFELLAPVPLNLICFAHRKGDDFNRRLLEHLNRSGKLFMTHTMLNGRYVLRFCIGQTHTEETHVRGAWKRIRDAAKGMGGS